MMRRGAVALPLLALLAASGRAEGGGPAKPALPDLRGAKIDDKPLTVTVPISGDSSLVVALPERYWILTSPGASRRVALEGEGVILEYIQNVMDGGFSADIFVGSAPLPESRAAETPDARVERGIAEFVSTLGDKYKHLLLRLLTEVDRIKWKKTTIQIDGRKVPAARTTNYSTRLETGDIMRTGEGVFFNVAGTDRLAYVVVDTAKGGTSLDKVVESLSVQKTNGCIRKARVAKLLLGATVVPKNVTRFATYEDPACFVPNYDGKVREDYVWAEDRFDDQGKQTASYRLERRELGEVDTLEEEGKLQMRLLEADAPEGPKKVGLATAGVPALVYSYKAKVADEDCTALTAVFRIEDQIWSLTWHTFGDEAHAKFDRISFERLLSGLQVAVR